jgi:acetyl-CoA C-acetyltransferase
MVCGSSLQAAALARQTIALGEADVIVAGGMESMSMTPYMVRNAREGFKLGNVKLEDSMVMDGLWCAIDNHHMGETGELVADKYGISREEMDEYAANSHNKAGDAIQNGRFKGEIVPVEVPMKKETVTFDTDEAVRPGSTAEGLSRLRPVFRKDGRVTAGNAPGTNDGAAAVMLMSREKADELGVKPIARVLGSAIGGLEPKWVMMTPVPAVNNLLTKLNMKKEDFDLYELNEAFSVQAIAVVRELGLDPSIVNVNGGAVALGHPIGASGARILTTLLYALKDRGLKRGIASMCLGGANGVSLAVEML